MTSPRSSSLTLTFRVLSSGWNCEIAVCRALSSERPRSLEGSSMIVCPSSASLPTCIVLPPRSEPSPWKAARIRRSSAPSTSAVVNIRMKNVKRRVVMSP